MADDKIHRQQMHHVHYHLIKYQVFWQPERSDFLYFTKKTFFRSHYFIVSSRVILASSPSLDASLSTVLISLQIKHFFSKALTFPTADQAACLNGESELSVLVFSSDELSDKLISPYLFWKVFFLFLKLTRHDV